MSYSKKNNEPNRLHWPVGPIWLLIPYPVRYSASPHSSEVHIMLLRHVYNRPMT